MHMSPRWGLGVGRFDVLLYTYRPAGALKVGLGSPRYAPPVHRSKPNS